MVQKFLTFLNSFPVVLKVSYILGCQVLGSINRLLIKSLYIIPSNLTLGDIFLLILDGSISKLFCRVGPNHGGSSYVIKQNCNACQKSSNTSYDLRYKRAIASPPSSNNVV